MTHFSCASAVFATLALFAPANSQAESRFGPVVEGADGKIHADGKSFSSREAFYASPEFRASGRRCAAEELTSVPETSFAPADCNMNMTSVLPEYEAEGGEEYVIQTVFHVVNADIPDAQIESQLDILNEDFLALTGTPGAPGPNSKVRFVFASIDPEGKPTNGINRVSENLSLAIGAPGRQTKSQLAWNTMAYFNFYVGNIDNGILGYATFPAQDAGQGPDGVVVGTNYFGRDSADPTYNQGRTATHEVGHYLGLFHTFQGGCSNTYSSGDRLVDTNPHQSQTFGCPTGATGGCAGGELDPITNYMNYTDDTCMTEFSPEQVNRMRCSLVNYRSLLFNALPIAEFQATVSELSVQFDEASTDADGTVDGWAWDFGDGNASTEQNPTHTYGAFGFYDVTLVVTDNRGVAGVLTKTITVNIPPVAAFDFSNTTDFEVTFVDKSTDSNGSITSWAWDFGDGNTSGAQSPTNLYAAVGTYSVSLTVTDDLDTTTTVTEMITIEEGGCGCASSGSTSTLFGNLGLLGFALFFVGRRRRRRRRS